MASLPVFNLAPYVTHAATIRRMALVVPEEDARMVIVYLERDGWTIARDRFFQDNEGQLDVTRSHIIAEKEWE